MRFFILVLCLVSMPVFAVKTEANAKTFLVDLGKNYQEFLNFNTKKEWPATAELKMIQDNLAEVHKTIGTGLQSTAHGIKFLKGEGARAEIWPDIKADFVAVAAKVVAMMKDFKKSTDACVSKQLLLGAKPCAARFYNKAIDIKDKYDKL